MEMREYNSLEEMQADMRAATDAANEGLYPAQIRMRDAVDTDSYWARLIPEYGNLWIFGECWSAARSRQSEVDCGADAEEADYTAGVLAESRRDGYLFGRCYSIVEPDGEIGSTHVSQVCPISKELFEDARRREWSLPAPGVISGADADFVRGLAQAEADMLS